MPSDAGAFSPSISPVVIDDASFRKDKNYRRYATAVEKAVSLFDATLQEWADYISFLGRLLKALQTKPNGVTSVPHTDLVAKRLAQCLDPRLPSGVHQKALEVYSYVFSILRKDGLSRDLPLYLPGLSPILSFASLSVKPLLLSLFEKYILTLDANTLLPALKAILLALLPGLEDDTSEEFERTHSLLNSIKDVIGGNDEEQGSRLTNTKGRAFWQSLFLATITSASRRAGALQYLTRNLPYLGRASTSENDPASKSPEFHRISSTVSPEVDQILSPEPGLLVRCFVAGLKDDQLLVQRGFLDLLVMKVPLSSIFLQQKVKSKDLELLLSAAASVVARRDMSLNRRLWAWFLGPESKDSVDKISPSNALQKTNTLTSLERSESHPHCSYFESFGLEPLTRSLHKMIAEPSISTAARARPFRISLALMDRSEIGNLIIPRIFIPLMESVWNYEKSATSTDSFSEVLRSAHVFFDGVQSTLIWAEVCNIIYKAMNGEQAASNVEDSEKSRLKLELVWFIISKFNVREEEMLLIHMPRACLIILLQMRALLISNADFQKGRQNASLKIALKIAVRLLDLIPERAFDNIPMPHGQEAYFSKELDRIDCDSFDSRSLLHIYQDAASNSEQRPQMILGIHAAQLILQSSSDLVVKAIDPSTHTIDPDVALAILSKTVRKSPQRYHVHSEKILSGLLKASAVIQSESSYYSAFPAIANLVSTFEFLGRTIPGDVWHNDHRIREIAINLIKSLWAALSPNKPQHAVESTRCLWKINAVAPGIQLVESAICSLMVDQNENELATIVTIDGAKCFTTLWTQTNSRLRSSSDRRSSLGRNKRREGRKASAEADEMDMLARPLSLLLDTLSEPSTPTLAFTVSWLQSLPNIQIIMDFLVQRLQSSPYVAEIISRMSPVEASEKVSNKKVEYAAKESLYHIQRISNIVKFCPNTVSTSLMSPIMTAEAATPKPASDSPAGQANIENGEVEMAPPTTRDFLLTAILKVLEEQFSGEKPSGNSLSLCKAILDLLQQLLRDSPGVDLNFDLESSLLKIITRAVDISDLLVQGYLMESLLSVLKVSYSKSSRPLSSQGRNPSQSHLLTETTEIPLPVAERPKPSPALLDCLLLGLNSSGNRPILDQWVTFLGDCLTFYDGQTFQILIPLVDCFRKSIEEVFEGLRMAFLDGEASSLGDIEPINTLNILLNGLEQTLGRGHQQLRQEEANTRPIKSPELSQGFFGNMVSGVFASDTQKSRSATANDRLTVLICFKDSVRVAFKLWSWSDIATGKPLSVPASSASFNYASIRLRNRARRLLEHLFAAEPLESMETLIEIWRGNEERDNRNRVTSALNLLHALDSSRPKNTIPTTFNALYSRTSPASLDPQQLSTLTSELSEFELVSFLVAYTRSIDDDALDEIWVDCMAFSRNVLGNPMPQRQILTRLLEFIAVLGEKINHTNFGEQRRMRKEIGDLFTRLLAAIFTVKPLAFSQDHGSSTVNEKPFDETLQNNRVHPKEPSDDVITILASTLPNILTLLVETDRIVSVSATISTQVLGPTFKSRRFPHSVTAATLEILSTISKVPELSKVWKKDVAEAFNDSKFFGHSSIVLAKEGWMPVIRQWALSDKDRMPEVLARLTAPASAGIMFGVGASSARLEADRRTQLNLRRIAFLLIAGETDDFLVNVNGIQEKLVELSSVTASSSPSSVTKAEMYMVMRALILKVSSIHLSSVWPILSSELFDSLSSLADADINTTLNVSCTLQAAKLLDLLITTAPDDFQLREWLYITDSVDAVYRPPNWKSTALVDNLADRLDNAAGAQHPSVSAQYIDVRRDGLRRPLIRHENIQGIPRDKKVIDQVLQPFLRQLSITAFESTYQMEIVDYDACVEELLYDLFDDSTLV